MIAAFEGICRNCGHDSRHDDLFRVASVIEDETKKRVGQAVLDEREACAKIVDDADSGKVLPAEGVATAIRNRP